jgi:hypothetical protein
MGGGLSGGRSSAITSRRDIGASISEPSAAIDASTLASCDGIGAGGGLQAATTIAPKTKGRMMFFSPRG